MPNEVFAGLRVGSTGLLAAIGLLLLVRPAVAEAVAGAVERPGRTFFLMTVLTPTVFGAWIALLASLPFADQGRALVVFVTGACLASVAWHLLLVAAARGVAGRLAPGVMRVVTRIGGASMVVIGAVGLAS